MSKNYLAEFRSASTTATPVKKFEMGGAAPAAAPAPAAPAGPEAGGDPMAQISQLVAQFAQTQDPQLAMQIASALVQMMGGGAAPEAAPAAPGPEAAPMAANGMKLRVFQKGGKLKK